MALGGGFELALAADLIIAADHARFCLPECRAGILADAGAIKLRRRIPYHVAVDMLMTGRWMEASEAERCGLLREVVPLDRLMPAARELADLIVNGPPLLYPAIKKALRETETMSVEEAFDALNNKRLATVRTLYESEDMVEGARAFAEKRDPLLARPLTAAGYVPVALTGSPSPVGSSRNPKSVVILHAMARLDPATRAELRDNAFAYIDSQRGRRRLPIHDEAHVRNALARFGQVKFEDAAARGAPGRDCSTPPRSTGSCPSASSTDSSDQSVSSVLSEPRRQWSFRPAS